MLRSCAWYLPEWRLRGKEQVTGLPTTVDPDPTLLSCKMPTPFAWQGGTYMAAQPLLQAFAYFWWPTAGCLQTTGITGLHQEHMYCLTHWLLTAKGLTAQGLTAQGLER